MFHIFRATDRWPGSVQALHKILAALAIHSETVNLESLSPIIAGYVQSITGNLRAEWLVILGYLAFQEVLLSCSFLPILAEEAGCSGPLKIGGGLGGDARIWNRILPPGAQGSPRSSNSRTQHVLVELSPVNGIRRTKVGH